MCFSLCDQTVDFYRLGLVYISGAMIKKNQENLMLHLDTKIGSGRHRTCYVHPEDSSKCVKVVFNPLDGGEKEVKRELGYYGKRAKQIKACRAVPNYYGTVMTNLGLGYVFDLILDFDGQVAKTLEYYLRGNMLPKALVENKLFELRNALIKHKISTMNLKEYNILYKRTADNDGYLVVVDNLGESEFIPVASLISSLHRKKIDRKFSRFLDKLNDGMWQQQPYTESR